MQINLSEETIKTVCSALITRKNTLEGLLIKIECGKAAKEKKEEKMVKEWEKETGNMVYHVIQNRMEFGLCYSFLYVSIYSEEWEMDNEGLKEGVPIVYVKNVDDEDCSEYGSIGIMPLAGGVLRTA